MSPNIDYLYIHSYSISYGTDPNEQVHKFALIFPDNVTVPANSLLNIDMKLRINLFCPYIPSFACSSLVSPRVELINTPLIYALPDMPLYDDGYATNLYIPVRNISGTDYNITAGDSLFNIVTHSAEPFLVKQVDEDHVSMQIRPI